MSDNGDTMSYTVKSVDQESGEQTGEKATLNLGGFELELHLPKLKDVGHPNVPEVSEDYISREINGKMDVELLSFMIEDPDFSVILEGEAAVGKNFSIDTVLGAANWPRVRVNFGLGTNYENLVGRYAPAGGESAEEDTIERSEAVRRTAQRIFEENDAVTFEKALELASQSLPSGSSFRWVDGLLTQAVKYGWAFVADEINAAEDEAIMPLNGITENREKRYLTIEEKSEVIEPHPNFRFIATRNPVTYSGVSDMNSALESRAYILKYDYHEADALKEILTSRTDVLDNISESELNSLVSLAQDIRRQEQSGNEYMTKISTRDLLKVCKLTNIMPIREATKTIFTGVADETDKDSIKELIRTQKFQ